MENSKCGSIHSSDETAAAEPLYDGIDKTKHALAEKLREVAYSVGEKATDPGTPAGVSCYEKIAADWLNDSAGYVERFEYRQVVEQARGYIRENPGSSLMTAGAAGFLIGAILKRR